MKRLAALIEKQEWRQKVLLFACFQNGGLRIPYTLYNPLPVNCITLFNVQQRMKFDCELQLDRTKCPKELKRENSPQEINAV